ncbi:MAG: hydroxymethylpyrimidine/phosphomethylpyrimidine kinase [Atopobiaceae bacterium]
MSASRQRGPHGAAPVVLTIAGLDPSGGAGLVADLKTIQAHGCCGMAVATAITAQNTLGVSNVGAVDAGLVRAQLDAVFQDVAPDAVKVGMVPNPEVAAAIADTLARWGASRIVVDPVMVSSTGTLLSNEQGKRGCSHPATPQPHRAKAPADEGVSNASAQSGPRVVSPSFLRLYRSAMLLTPNLDEAEAMLGALVRTRDQRQHAARVLAAQLGSSALLKAGHAAGDADDILALATDGAPLEVVALQGERLPGAAAHGTGCALSSAIACGLARGLDLADACRAAKRYVAGGLAHEPGPGRGVPPIDHLWFKDLESRLAWPWDTQGPQTK